MIMSEQVDKLFEALVGVHTDLLSVKADSKVQAGAVRYKYASLEAVLETVKPVLGHAGLAISQFPADAPDGNVGLTTLILHESGQWLGSTLHIPLAKKDAQGYGSALSYARRYGIMAVLGLATEDDDGASASRPNPAPQTTPKQPETKGESESDKTGGKPDPHALIDGLIDQLRGKGLGQEAAQLTVKYGGYGNGIDEMRALYRELKALLDQPAQGEAKMVEGGQIASLQSSVERIFKIPKGEAGSEARAKIWGLAFDGGGSIPTNSLTFERASWLLTKGLPHIEGQFKKHKTPINERMTTLETLIDVGQAAFTDEWEAE